MPRTSIPITDIGNQAQVSLPWLAVDAVNGMMFPNNGKTLLLVRNADTTGKTVTVVSVPDEAGRSGNLAITVTASGGENIAGPFQTNWWNQAGSDAGNVYVNFSAATSLSVVALRPKL